MGKEENELWFLFVILLLLHLLKIPHYLFREKQTKKQKDKKKTLRLSESSYLRLYGNRIQN
jgi:hypothetical protein